MCRYLPEQIPIINNLINQNIMKKSLLLMFAFVAMTLSAFADQVTLSWTAADWSKQDDKGWIIAYTNGNYSLTANKQGGSSAPVVNTTDNDLRLYAKGTLEIVNSANNMTSMTFYISKKGQYRLADIKASTGTVTIDATNWMVTWTGSAKSVTFTCGEKATYGTDGASKAGQFDFAKVDIVADGDNGGGDVTPPTPIDPIEDLTPKEEAQPDAAGNYLINGDFEAWESETVPTNWLSKTTASTKKAIAQSTDARGGQYAVTIASDTNEDVSKRQNYRLAYKELLLPAGDYVYTVHAKGAGAVIELGYAHNFQNIVYTYQQDGDANKMYNLTGDYQECVYEFTLTEATALNMVVMCHKSSNGAVAIVDDVTLVRKGDATPPVPDGSIFSETFAQGQGQFTINNYTYDPTIDSYTDGLPEGLSYVWKYDSYGYMKASAYVSGTKYDVAADLVSPAISLAGYKNCTIVFDQAAKNFGTEEEEIMENIYYNAYLQIADADEWDDTTLSDEELTMDWPDLDVYPLTNTWDWVTSTADISLLDGRNAYIFFSYISSEECCGTWEVKNVKIFGENSEGVTELIATVPVKAVAYDLQGRRISKAQRGINIVGGQKVLVK